MIFVCWIVCLLVIWVLLLGVWCLFIRCDILLVVVYIFVLILFGFDCLLLAVMLGSGVILWWIIVLGYLLIRRFCLLWVGFVVICWCLTAAFVIELLRFCLVLPNDWWVDCVVWCLVSFGLCLWAGYWKVVLWFIFVWLNSFCFN